MPVAQDWQNIYGQGFGYSADRMRGLFERGARDIDEQSQLGIRRGTTDLSQRGFYSARPMQRMVGEVESKRTKALSDYRFGLEQQSNQLAEQQKGRLFSAQSAETMSRENMPAQQAFQKAMALQRQGFDLKRMDIQQQYTLYNMAKQNDYNESFAKFQHDLNKPGFMGILGSVLGTVAGGFAGGAGGWAAERLFGGEGGNH